MIINKHQYCDIREDTSHNFFPCKNWKNFTSPFKSGDIIRLPMIQKGGPRGTRQKNFKIWTRYNYKANPRSCTPCDASVTVSRSGHLAASMRLLNSVSSASGTFT